MLTDFHVGAVEGANRESTIHGELHVAGAGGFLPCSRDLFGKIRRWIHLFAQLHVVVSDEHNPQTSVHVGISVDRFGDAVDEADDQLGHVIARCRLATKDHRARRHAIGLAVFDPEVLGNHLQSIEVLAFVLMNPLHLYVKQA